MFKFTIKYKYLTRGHDPRKGSTVNDGGRNWKFGGARAQLKRVAAEWGRQREGAVRGGLN